jgi:hypothetical protein
MKNLWNNEKEEDQDFFLSLSPLALGKGEHFPFNR